MVSKKKKKEIHKWNHPKIKCHRQTFPSLYCIPPHLLLLFFYLYRWSFEMNYFLWISNSMMKNQINAYTNICSILHPFILIFYLRLAFSFILFKLCKFYGIQKSHKHLMRRWIDINHWKTSNVNEWKEKKINRIHRKKGGIKQNVDKRFD